ncbi:MAG: cytochrome oxidase subunit III [Deltaproteobacteria bacterium]|nr:cytochrome oxidase subunit III [Deltaproteobacteria bacterium]
MDTHSETWPSTVVPNAKMGVWWFLASEITVFGGLIASYLVVRLGSGDWAEHAAHLSMTLALINTFVLLTSSFTMVMALAEVHEQNPKGVRVYLALTVILGLVFLGIKAIEYTSEIGQGFTPGSGIFWSYYYGMTGLHALHVLAGIVVNTVLLFGAMGKDLRVAGTRIEVAGLYWHFVDIVWIFLFPLLYLS